jgi:anti-sigma factor RsiW
MNNGPIIESDLHAFVDEALGPERRIEVAHYLANHPEVAQRVQSYRRQRNELRAALAPVAEEPVPPELSLGRMMKARRTSRAARWQTAAAAVLVLGIGGAGGWTLHSVLQPPRAGIGALAQEATDSYAVYAPDRARPVEIMATDRSELVKWASERLSRPVSVPDLSASNYRFIGGRLIATAHGPAVLFMYDDDHGTRLVLLSRDMAIDKNAPMAQHSLGPITGFAWADKGIGYSLVGHISSQLLHSLADEARRQLGSDVQTDTRGLFISDRPTQ